LVICCYGNLKSKGVYSFAGEAAHANPKKRRKMSEKSNVAPISSQAKLDMALSEIPKPSASAPASSYTKKLSSLTG
jgi:hypothetical protein